MAALAILAVSSLANAGIVDPANSYATLANAGTMLVAPGGADSFVFPDDHLIDVYVNDSSNNPVEVVATDIWLQDPVVVWCAGGVVADSSTFAPDPGHTTFSLTPRGGVNGVSGDCNAISLNVIAVGNEIASLDLKVVSPDLNGSGGVNIADFGVFGGFFNQVSGVHCADLDKGEGANSVNISDFAIFGGYFNQSNCP